MVKEIDTEGREPICKACGEWYEYREDWQFYVCVKDKIYESPKFYAAYRMRQWQKQAEKVLEPEEPVVGLD